MTVPALIEQIDALAARWLAFVAHEVVYSTILFLAVLLIARVLRGRLPRLHYWLWWLVLLRLVLPPALWSPFSLGTLLDRTPSPRLAAVRPAALPAPEAPGRETGGPGPRAFPWRSLLLLTHVAGVLAVATCLHRKLAACRHLARHGDRVVDPDLLAAANRWCRVLGVRRPLRIVTSDTGLPPLTLGLLRPVIHLPAAVLRQAEPVVTESVLAHEIAHVKRWDYFWLRLQNVIQVVYFFHPVVWLTGSRINEERERICDDLVIAPGLIARQSYAGSVLAVLGLELEVKGLKGLGHVPLLGSPKRRLSMRIRHILGGGGDSFGKRLLSFSTAIAAGTLLLPMAGSPRLSSAADDTPALSSDLRLGNPLPGGWVSSPFGDRKNPFSGAEEHHDGVDVASPERRWLLAPADGVVTEATSSYAAAPHLGTVVRIDHGSGLETFYAHLGDLEVEAGQRVYHGDRLARVGDSGLSTGPHVHIEVWRDGKAIDPAATVVPRWRKVALSQCTSASPTPSPALVQLDCKLEVGGAEKLATVLTVLSGELASIEESSPADVHCPYILEMTAEVVPSDPPGKEMLIELQVRAFRLVDGERRLVMVATGAAPSGSLLSFERSGDEAGRDLLLTITTTL